MDDITAPQTSAGSSSGTSTNTSGSRSFLPTFSNVGVGLKANVQGTLGGSQTTTTGNNIPKWPTLDQANLQLWTGAGWRNDKTTSGSTGNANDTKFTSATGSGSGQGSSSGTNTSAGNPDGLQADKVDQNGQVKTSVQEATSGDNLTNYTNLPPTSPPPLIDRTRCHSPTRTTRSAPSCSCAACWAASRCWLISPAKMITVSLRRRTKNGPTPTYSRTKPNWTSPLTVRWMGCWIRRWWKPILGTRERVVRGPTRPVHPVSVLKFPNKVAQTQRRRLCWSPPGWLERRKTLVTSLSVAPASASSSAGG
ncbi:adhesin P1 homolog [Mycoplasmoides pneumoniae]|nr:adhesin P1 homolog [Mycoplasmoides pneumoniae]